MNNPLAGTTMIRTPGWVWKQRSVVMRFMVAFYLRRVLQRFCNAVPFVARRRQRAGSAPPLPTRRSRSPSTNAKQVD